MKGILLDANYDVIVKNGSLKIGDTTDQNAALVLKMKQGDLKEDLLLGPGLSRFIRGKYNASQIEQTIRAHFIRAGINFEEYRDRLQNRINTTGL